MTSPDTDTPERGPPPPTDPETLAALQPFDGAARPRPAEDRTTVAMSVSTQKGARPRIGWDRRPAEWKWTRNFYYHNLWIEHQLCRGGLLRRFVIVDTEQLRDVLRQPRRREIDPLHAQQPEYELRTSELWELAGHDALVDLQAVYAGVQTELAKLRATQSQRPRRAPTLGHLVRPTDWKQEARGILLHAEPDALYLWDPEQLQLRRIPGPALDAIRLAEARPGQTIYVEPDVHHTISIEEERSGTHGSGQRILRRRVPSLKVHRMEQSTARAAAQDTHETHWRRAYPDGAA